MRSLRVLQNGFWETTTLEEDAGGRRYVCKASTPAGAHSPWGLTALRAEIGFLRSLPPAARRFYPELLGHWDDAGDPAAPRVGYRIPYYGDYRDVSACLQDGLLSQQDADAIQALLAEAVFEATHCPSGRFAIGAHLIATIETALPRLRALPEFADCINLPEIVINGTVVPGLDAAFTRVRASAAMKRIDALPTVRLHGDLILENVLWRPGDAPAIRLIDPVSVAGIWQGPAVFDLVKYASYATGELFALRAGMINAGPAPRQANAYVYEVPPLPAFRRVDLLSAFARAFEQSHGVRDPAAEHLLDGYFALVMAVNTAGIQHWGRVLKGILALHAAAEAEAPSSPG